MTLNPTAMMTARPTRRHTTLLVIAAAAFAAGACSDTSRTPTSPNALERQNASTADTSHSGTTSTPRPDSGVRHDTVHARPDSSGNAPHDTTVVTRPDSVRPGPGTLAGVAVQNFVLQWKDSNGVSHDSAGYRGVGGVTVTIYATPAQPDSTSSTPRPETLVATLQSDATGQFRSAKLPDGWYTVRGAGGGKTGSSWAHLFSGNQSPSIIFLNMR